MGVNGNGKLDLLERVRTQKKACEKVIELSAIAIRNKQIERICVLHVNAVNIAEQIASEKRTRMSGPSDIQLVEVMIGLSVHSGAGMVGTVFVVK